MKKVLSSRLTLSFIATLLAAGRLSDAAEIVGRHPVTIQLRYLQTLMEVSGNQSSKIVFPVWSIAATT